MKSPNFGPRVGVAAPDMVVIHYTAMESCEAALERLCDPVHEVSAHYVVRMDGQITQLVREEDRAWHAGVSSWEGHEDINSRSIGIELDYPGALLDHPPFPAPQIDALCQLLSDIQERWSVQPRRVVGHSDIALGRKADPGSKFDWQHLARLGLAEASTPLGDIPCDEAAFRAALGNFGYRSDSDLAPLLSAFRLRWRQGQDGPFDARDCAIAAGLPTLTGQS